MGFSFVFSSYASSVTIVLAYYFLRETRLAKQIVKEKKTLEIIKTLSNRQRASIITSLY